ncbi:hypothetical protein PFISCL1PPCAC_7961, partial [Pristionchus fissidentatus]
PLLCAFLSRSPHSLPSVHRNRRFAPRSRQLAAVRPHTMLGPLEIAIRSQQAGNANSSPQLVAIALMHRLHVLCVQLFLTILHVIGDHVEAESSATVSSSRSSPPPAAMIDESRKIRKLAEIEAKMLRHVTSPLIAVRPAEPRRSRRGHPASRPPSPQLFAIDEEDC